MENTQLESVVPELQGEAPTGKARVLAADDDGTILMMLESMLLNQGYEVMTASDGKEAWEKIQAEKDNLDIVLLDRIMPEMDGMDVVKKMKAHPELKKMPIIMQTGSDKPEQIKEGIDAGVFYYLTKPFTEEVLSSVAESAVREARHQKALKSEMQKHRMSFNLIKSAAFFCRTLEEAENLSCFIANCFPDPDRVLPGLAELMINAIEHGTYNVGYDLKTQLIADGNWREEIELRQTLPEYATKRVEVQLLRREDSVAVRITDQGEGFTWQDYLEVDPSRAADNHGRGIAQANMISFDEVKFNTKGNQVSASVMLEQDLEW